MHDGLDGDAEGRRTREEGDHARGPVVDGARTVGVESEERAQGDPQRVALAEQVIASLDKAR